MDNIDERKLKFKIGGKKIIKHWSIIVVATVFSLATVFIGLQLKTPEYEASVKMFILAKKQIDSPYYKDTGDFRSNEMTLTHSEIVKSNPIIERVVKRLNLDEISPDYEMEFATALKKTLIGYTMKNEARRLESESPESRKQRLFREAVERLKKNIKVEPIRDTNLFTISYSDFSAVNAAQIANAISRSYCIFDMEQQLAELEQKYGEKHLSVIQLKENIDKMDNSLNGDQLSNIEAIGPASVKIIEQATAPVKPKGLPKKIIYASAIAMSIALGAILATFF